MEPEALSSLWAQRELRRARRPTGTPHETLSKPVTGVVPSLIPPRFHYWRVEVMKGNIESECLFTQAADYSLRCWGSSLGKSKVARYSFCWTPSWLRRHNCWSCLWCECSPRDVIESDRKLDPNQLPSFSFSDIYIVYIILIPNNSKRRLYYYYRIKGNIYRVDKLLFLI